MPPRALPPPQWDLVTESFSEAAFLWARWEDALDSPLHTLDDVVRTVEQRLIGALDGVRMGGRRAVQELLIPGLRSRRRYAVTVSAHLLGALGRIELGEIIQALATLPVERLAYVRRGLECCAAEWTAVLAYALPGLRPEAQAAVLDAFAFSRFHMPAGVDGGLARGAPAVQEASLRLAATVHQPWTMPYIEWGMPRSNLALRIEATRAGMLRAHPQAVASAQDLISRGAEGSDILLPLFAIARGERVLPVLASRVDAGEAKRELFDALACVGSLAAADVCAAVLHCAPQARLAADALSAITGLDPRPPAGTPQPDDGPADQLLLPAPCVETLRAAWQQARPHYDEEHRYLGGRPFNPATITQTLRGATMRRRNMLAQELILRTEGHTYLTTRTWTAVQRSQLRGLAA